MSMTSDDHWTEPSCCRTTRISAPGCLNCVLPSTFPHLQYHPPCFVNSSTPASALKIRIVPGRTETTCGVPSTPRAEVMTSSKLLGAEGSVLDTACSPNM